MSTEHNADSTVVEGVTIRWADHPEVEDRMKALDHLDAAYDLLLSRDAEATNHIHVARVEVERNLGAVLFRIGRAAKNISSTTSLRSTNV